MITIDDLIQRVDELIEMGKKVLATRTFVLNRRQDPQHHGRIHRILFLCTFS